jgi:hypothetical protein
MLTPLFAPEDALATRAGRSPAPPANDEEAEFKDGVLYQRDIAHP